MSINKKEKRTKRKDQWLNYRAGIGGIKDGDEESSWAFGPVLARVVVAQIDSDRAENQEGTGMEETVWTGWGH